MSEHSAAPRATLAAQADQRDGAGIDIALGRNHAFAAAGGYQGATIFPALRLLVVTCLDPRVDPAQILGLGLGDAMVVRNGGGRVTPEVINSIAFVGELAATAVPKGLLFEVAVVHHTQCGSAALADDSFSERFAQRTGADASTLREYAVVDPAASVASDVDRLRSAAAITSRITVSGHVYDVATGLVKTVAPAAAARDGRGTDEFQHDRAPGRRDARARCGGDVRIAWIGPLAQSTGRPHTTATASVAAHQLKE